MYRDIDWMAVTTALIMGWETESFREKSFFHHRHLGNHARIGNDRNLLSDFPTETASTRLAMPDPRDTHVHGVSRWSHHAGRRDSLARTPGMLRAWPQLGLPIGGSPRFSVAGQSHGFYPWSITCAEHARQLGNGSLLPT